VRYLLGRRVPEIVRVLVVESGARAISERLLPTLRTKHGPGIAIDLVTCYHDLPVALGPAARVFRVQDYAGRAGHKRLYHELRAGSYSALGIFCSAEPIMTKWKWALAAHVPAKLFIVNENADYFWLDYSNWRIAARLARLRSGLSGTGLFRTLARLVVFPFTLTYLLLYAAWVHSLRILRHSHNQC
jgi:hypothetical protein